MMKIVRTRTPLVCAWLAIFAMAPLSDCALAGGLGNPKEFTMEAHMMAVTGDEMTMKWFVGKDRLRMSMSADGMPDAGIHIMLYDGDQVTMYMLMPQMKMYMKRVGTPESMSEDSPALVFGMPGDSDHPCSNDPEVTCEHLGADTWLGRDVEKYRVSEVMDGESGEQTVWIDSELKVGVKFEGDDGVMEATSIEVGKQPDELFEIPAGFREMSMSR